jgi:lipoprotein-anchoring transpeptidase ErfK/SrfK
MPVSATKIKKKVYPPLSMKDRFSRNVSDRSRIIFLLLLSLVFLGFLSCRPVVPPPPSVVIIPLPSETLLTSSGPSEEDVAKTARPVVDIPPPVPVLPPLKEEIKVLPPEQWKIVVNKTQRKLFLYQQGELCKMYPVDLGKNPKGPKLHQGDMKTPEGDYRVIEKRDRGQTQFYLAFLLNYPNEIDRRRYEMAVKNGVVPNEIGIGSLIEIHGEGIGFDWTKGCIALDNRHMQELFRQIPVGTVVKIEP